MSMKFHPIEAETTSEQCASEVTQLSAKSLESLKAASPQVYQHIEKLLGHQDGLLVVKIAPHLIKWSRFANRHPESFRGIEFDELLNGIRTRNGNTQPILVRPVQNLDPSLPSGTGDAPLFEIISGHRRHHACRAIGLSVSAIIVPGITDNQLAMAMFDENHARINIKPFEAGHMYAVWLKQKLFSSQNKLAKAIGKAASDVSRALFIARMPEVILQAFESRLDLQLKDADAFKLILAGNRKAALHEAAVLAGLPQKKKRAEVLRLLQEASSGNDSVGSTNTSRKTSLLVDERPVGSISWDAKGKGRLTLDEGLSAEAQETFEAMLATIVKAAFARSNTVQIAEPIPA